METINLCQCNNCNYRHPPPPPLGNQRRQRGPNEMMMIQWDVTERISNYYPFTPILLRLAAAAASDGAKDDPDNHHPTQPPPPKL